MHNVSVVYAKGFQKHTQMIRYVKRVHATGPVL